jgi:hypothetical protein
MVRMAYDRIFRTLFKSILALILKHDLTLAICSPITHIYKKYLMSGSNCFEGNKK